MTSRVFVAYARRDEAHAIQVAALLQARGVDAWLDLERVSPGSDLTGQISAAIGGAAAVVWVARRDTPLSRWVGLELSWAMSAGTPIHAVAPDGSEDLDAQVAFVWASLADTVGPAPALWAGEPD